MEFSEILLPLIILLFGVILFFKIRILNENERFAVITVGRFAKLMGPGLMLKFSGGETHWVKLKLRQSGTYLGDGQAEFDGVAVPVVFNSEPKHGIRITGFREEKIWVSPSDTLTVKCEKCGHENTIAV